MCVAHPSDPTPGTGMDCAKLGLGAGGPHGEGLSQHGASTKGCRNPGTESWTEDVRAVVPAAHVKTEVRGQ